MLETEYCLRIPPNLATLLNSEHIEIKRYSIRSFMNEISFMNKALERMKTEQQ